MRTQVTAQRSRCLSNMREKKHGLQCKCCGGAYFSVTLKTPHEVQAWAASTNHLTHVTLADQWELPCCWLSCFVKLPFQRRGGPSDFTPSLYVTRGHSFPDFNKQETRKQ